MAIVRKPRRGMGDCYLDPEAGAPACDINTPSSTANTTTTPAWQTALYNSLPGVLQQGFKTLQLAITPTGGYLVSTPGGGYTISNSGGLPPLSSFGGTANLGSILMWGGIAVLGIAALGAMKK